MKPQSFGPFERTILTKDILSKLRLDVILGNLKPGVRVVETQLSSEYGVSRGPIRTALQMLEQEGLVKTLPNGGTVIVGFSNKDAEDMFDFRLMMEYKALELILQNPMVSYAPILEITEMIRDIHNKGEEISAQQITALDIQFHRSLMIMAENQQMQRAWDTMSNLLYTILNIANTTYDSFFDFYKKHKELADAIIQKNQDCYKILDNHILGAKVELAQRLSKQLKGK
ncbi:GntR family transcriptional regulator [Paenibacillus sp. GCM10027626]|uniref:GntR family transcriptional regulator n=1 Tax=Paenibacillus sp. GCM10027626 TaxID=3273411 RepID=UPI003635BA45